MRLGQFNKSPNDRKRYVVDYIDWLDTDETIVSANATTPANTPSPFRVDGVVVGQELNSIVFYVSGGIEGGSHIVTITINTSKQQIKEDFIVFAIRTEGRNP